MSDSTVVFSLRLPAALDARVRKAAEQSGRSLNTEMLERLSSTFGPDRNVARVLSLLELPAVRRVRHASTTQAVEHILVMINTFGIERVVLAARADPLNDAVLILLLQTADHVIILDQSSLNMARRPRMLEVSQVFKALDDNGLLSDADYCPTLLPESTRELPAEAVAATLLRENQRLNQVEDFLALLAPHGQYTVRDYGGKKIVGKKLKVGSKAVLI